MFNECIFVVVAMLHVGYATINKITNAIQMKQLYEQ